MDESIPSIRGGRIVKPEGRPSRRRTSPPDLPFIEEDKFAIPSWDNLHKIYEEKWLIEREKFYDQLKENFRGLISQYRTGKQEIHQLTETPYTKKYIRAFRELFSDAGYQASVGEVEHTSNKQKIRKLFITLPKSV